MDNSESITAVKRAENVTLRHEAQGETGLNRLEILADDLDPEDCSVEVIRLNDNLDWRLRCLLRGGRVHVRNVVPCPSCGAPIAVLRLETERTLRICDAVQEPDCPERWRDHKTPDWYQAPWTANVFVMHDCPGDQQ
jgi:hypothetical protein